MIEMNPSMGEVLIMAWFALSTIVEIIGTTIFWVWLRRRGAKLIFGLAGTPGYLELAYVRWCRNQGRHPNIRLFVFRALSLINVVTSGILFILFVATRR